MISIGSSHGYKDGGRSRFKLFAREENENEQNYVFISTEIFVITSKLFSTHKADVILDIKILITVIILSLRKKEKVNMEELKQMILELTTKFTDLQITSSEQL